VHVISALYVPYAPTSRVRPVMAAQKDIIKIKRVPWEESQGSRSIYVHAYASDDDIGHCGVEVLPLSADGLLGDEDDAGSRAMLSGTLYVSKNCRRQGVAQRLLREAEACVRGWGLSELRLMVDKKNTAARQLYEKMGYVVVGDSEYHGAQVCMCRHLYSPTQHTLASLMPQHTKVRRSIPHKIR